MAGSQAFGSFTLKSRVMMYSPDFLLAIQWLQVRQFGDFGIFLLREWIRTNMQHLWLNKPTNKKHKVKKWKN